MRWHCLMMEYALTWRNEVGNLNAIFRCSDELKRESGENPERARRCNRGRTPQFATLYII